MDVSRSKTNRLALSLAGAAVVLALIVVSLGAFSRLVDAGLGCPDWPGCYGHLLWPNDAEELARAAQAFPHAPVEHDKTWPEMVHRYFASVLGLLIAGLAFIAWRRRGVDGFPFRLPLLLLFIVVWQAIFGMWTVTLKLWPQVVTAHLLGGVATFSLSWVLFLRLRREPWRLTSGCRRRLAAFQPWLVVAIILVVLQIALGGWLSSNYAAFACSDFPQCQQQWWPSMDLAAGFNLFQTVGPNYLGGLLTNEARIAIHVVHRVGALAVFAYLSLFCLALFRVDDVRIKRLAALIFAALLVQVALGISNVLWAIPLPVAVLHNVGAAVLLLTLATLGVQMWAVKRLPANSEQRDKLKGEQMV